MADPPMVTVDDAHGVTPGEGEVSDVADQLQRLAGVVHEAVDLRLGLDDGPHVEW